MASPLPEDFLRGPAPKIEKQRIDFASTALPCYKDLYAVVMDNVLTAEECRQLVALSEAACGGKWERAMVNRGNGQQVMLTHTRNCDRIIWDNHDVVARLWDRIKVHVPEILTLEKVPLITGHGPAKRGEVYRATRLNERMRFLRYGADEYFREHCDGIFLTPDETERTYFTVHLYLNESGPGNPLVGGATTFHHDAEEAKTYDIVPKVGRVLLFQQKGLWHSGQDVEQGVKLTMRTEIFFASE